MTNLTSDNPSMGPNLMNLNRGFNARKVISEVYAFFFTAVYCHWAVMLTQDRCRSLTWDPYFI